jgi:hypothetical protein
MDNAGTERLAIVFKGENTDDYIVNKKTGKK